MATPLPSERELEADRLAVDHGASGPSVVPGSPSKAAGSCTVGSNAALSEHEGRAADGGQPALAQVAANSAIEPVTPQLRVARSPSEGRGRPSGVPPRGSHGGRRLGLQVVGRAGQLPARAAGGDQLDHRCRVHRALSGCAARVEAHRFVAPLSPGHDGEYACPAEPGHAGRDIDDAGRQACGRCRSGVARGLLCPPPRPAPRQPDQCRDAPPLMRRARRASDRNRKTQGANSSSGDDVRRQEIQHVADGNDAGRAAMRPHDGGAKKSGPRVSSISGRHAELACRADAQVTPAGSPGAREAVRGRAVARDDVVTLEQVQRARISLAARQASALPVYEVRVQEAARGRRSS